MILKMGVRKVPFTRKVYIDRNDFRIVVIKTIISPGARVYKVSRPIIATSFSQDSMGQVTVIRTILDDRPEFKKTKGL